MALSFHPLWRGWTRSQARSNHTHTHINTETVITTRSNGEDARMGRDSRFRSSPSSSLTHRTHSRQHVGSVHRQWIRDSDAALIALIANCTFCQRLWPRDAVTRPSDTFGMEHNNNTNFCFFLFNEGDVVVERMRCLLKLRRKKCLMRFIESVLSHRL